MRIGTVTHIDPILRRGYIEDENEQDICFTLDSSTEHISAADSVSFEIILDQNGLIATHLKRLAESENTQSYGSYFCPDSHTGELKQFCDYR
ncbi:hypothetical protein [Pedobacter frigidisoli]|uniref:hypothetical protein n=1 Tax=Pedobacter frigidisoli TaxID=2530455 RepID=UPI00292EB81A|nr:hypothetical protein [Pedobacter frigidisoli]